jgi:geranylgeranyl pyrophosphate synthase
MDYSEKIAKEYSNKAIRYIENIPDSIYKQSLINFANFVIERNI